MNDKDKKAEFDDEREQLNAKASSALGKALEFLDDLPEGPVKRPIPFPYGSTEPRPYGWFSK